MESQPQVVVAMSGGVDSSTTAAILKDQGYQVTGLTMILSDDIDNDALLQGVRSVTDHLKIELHICDFRDDFKRGVIDYFIGSYESGLTPNPCVICNRRIKFGSMLKATLNLGADYLATGHYVRIDRQGELIRLLKGIDQTKDQSYFLYRLQQDQLKHILFPLGTYKKTEIRKIAADYSLPVADKAESQDLCFIGKGSYRDFLQTHATISSQIGPIKDLQGNEVGIHNGLWNYTVGQRRGLGVAFSEPLYVVELDIKNNILVVATDQQRGRDEFMANSVSYISGVEPTVPFTTEVKIRYTARSLEARVTPLSDNKVKVNLMKQLPDVTPGQSVVFYEGEVLIGGGFIE